MADVWQVQDTFWNSFGIPSYDDQTLSVIVSYPHMTYESFDGVIDQTNSLSINLWYRASSWAGIKQKAEEIKQALKDGQLLEFEGGYLWLKMPETSVFAQPFDTGVDDTAIKRIVITVEAEVLST